MATKKTDEITDPLADHPDMNRRDFLSTTAAVGGAMVVGFEEGFGFVHPLAVRKQIEGQIHWGYDEAMYQENTVRDGRCVEHNIDTFPISRMNEYPREVNIAYFKTKFWVYGAGEEAIPQIPPALYNAVFKITGKRFRSLPLKHHDLSWG